MVSIPPICTGADMYGVALAAYRIVDAAGLPWKCEDTRASRATQVSCCVRPISQTGSSVRIGINTI